MIQIIVHLWHLPNRETEFRVYEEAALQIFSSHGGRVLEILRPDAALSSAPMPDEIHRLAIDSLENWQSFRSDEQLKSMGLQRAACISQTQVFICPNLKP